MTKKLYAGDTYAQTLTFKDADDTLFDPTTITCTFLDPDGTQSGDALDIDDLTKTATGTYELLWTIPEDAEAGTWTLKVKATYEVTSLTETEEFPFEVFTQPYGVLSEVKLMTHLEGTTDNDETLIGYMTKATRWINVQLRKAGETSLPLSPVPPEINDVASEYAAGKFLQRDVAEEKEHVYVVSAKENLQAYIDAVYCSDLPILIATEE